MHLFSASTAVLLSPFRTEMLAMSQMWFTVRMMTTFEIALIAPRAACIWYHLWCKDPIVSGVKVDIIQAMSFPLFSFSCSCYSPFYILFLTCILDVFWSCFCQNYCFIYIKVRGLVQDWTPVPSCCFPFRALGKHLSGIDEGLLDQVDSTSVWCEYAS